MTADLLFKATAAHQAGDLPRALTLYEKLLGIDKKNDVAWHNYGVALADLDRQYDAVAAFLKCVNINPNRPDSWLALARACVKSRNATTALPILQKLVVSTTDPDIYYLYSLALDQTGDNDAAKTAATQAGTLAFTNNPSAWLDLAIAYLERESYILALTALDQAVIVDPHSIPAQWLHAFSCALPIYQTQQQVSAYHQLYTERTATLLERLEKLPATALKDLEYLINVSHGLFLGYNGQNVREAQMNAARIFQLVMNAAAPVAPIQKIERDKPVLAIVSETFYYHSNMKLRRSWLRRINRTKFKLCLYHVGGKTDFYTDEIRELCDEFHHFPKDLQGVLTQLQSDAPDIIQYTNIGLNTLTLKLAALRLAPVQATTWGHPITSGYDSIDYYLSSELMEPVDADMHYSEQLVRLPGLSVVPEKIFTFLPPQEFTRADFGLGESDVIYLCPQSVQKYLPKHDGIYAAIALQVPQAKFIFIDSLNGTISQTFRNRLQNSFVACGLDPARHLRFLLPQDQPHYRALHQLADVTLDSLGWSGANTSFEALELGGLLLTRTSEFMRGQHTAAILQFMEMTELVAANEDDYIRHAIRLGLDTTYRTEMLLRLQESLPKLYRDPDLGATLNGFYQSAVSKI